MLSQLTYLVSQSFILAISNHPLYQVSKGISANLLKETSKRRRTRTQIQADKEAASQIEADTQAKLAQLAAAE